jgi:hypothetical protein
MAESSPRASASSAEISRATLTTAFSGRSYARSRRNEARPAMSRAASMVKGIATVRPTSPSPSFRKSRRASHSAWCADSRVSGPTDLGRAPSSWREVTPACQTRNGSRGPVLDRLGPRDPAACPAPPRRPETAVPTTQRSYTEHCTKAQSQGRCRSQVRTCGRESRAIEQRVGVEAMTDLFSCALSPRSEGRQRSLRAVQGRARAPARSAVEGGRCSASLRRRA